MLFEDVSKVSYRSLDRKQPRQKDLPETDNILYNQIVPSIILHGAQFPDNHVPGNESAFKSTVIKYDSWRGIPLARAYDAIHSNGINYTHSMKNTLSVVNERTGSFIAVKSGKNTLADGGEGAFGREFARISK